MQPIRNPVRAKLFLVLAGIFLNVTIIYVIQKVKRKSVSSLFISTIAIVDFLQCIFGILPIIAGNLARAANRWPISGLLGLVGCNGYSFLSVGLRTLGYYLVALVALDRRKVIKKPFSNRCNEKNAKIALLMLTLSALIVGLPPIFGISNFQFDPAINICSLNWCRKGVGGLYAKLYVVCTYVASIIICAVSYHEIFQVTVRQSKKKRALNSSSLRLHDEAAESMTQQYDERRAPNARRTPRERKRNHKKSQVRVPNPCHALFELANHFARMFNVILEFVL